MVTQIPPAGIRAGSGIAWDRLIPSWPLLIALFVFARLLATPTALLHDPDTYMHIAAGRWILAHWALPVHDPFSHSMPGATWISCEWLAQAVLAALYDGFGWSGVVLATAACAAAAVGTLTHFLLRRLEPLPALIAAVAAFALLEPHILARPHILALPLLVLWTGLLLAARDFGRSPPFWALPVVSLWANLHASFLFGLALAAFLGCEAVLQPGSGRSRLAEARSWGAFALAACIVALVNPHGVEALIQPIRLMRMPALQANFAEWLSPDFQKSPVIEIGILGLLLIGFASGIRLSLTRLLLVLGLVHLTLQHVRHADLLAIVAPLAIAAPLGRRLAELIPGSPVAAWFTRLARPPGAAALTVAAALAVLIALPVSLHPLVRADDDVTPAAALDAAQRLGLSGPVLNSEAFGGYLMFRGVPTFIDGRVEMYGNDFVADASAAEHGDHAELRTLLQRYRIAWALLLPDCGAVTAIDRLPGWRRVYADRYAVIYGRSDATAR